jgi:hypothetical protein
MAGENLERIMIDNLARGMSENLPPTRMSANTQGPLWRLLKNIRPHDGELFREAALDSVTTPLGSSIVGNTPPAGALDSTDNNIQTPMIIKTYLEGEYILCVTTQQIWWYIAASDAWVSLNPEYDEDSESDGTGTGTGPHQIQRLNGSNTQFEDITNAALKFSDRRICAGMYVILDPNGDDNGPITSVIDVVDSNVRFNVADDASAITHSRDIDFKIVRTFRNDYFYPMFAEVFNGNLYVSGKVAPATKAVTAVSTPGVIKVTDVFRSAVTGQDAKFLMGQQALHDTSVHDDGDNTQFHQISTLEEIMGMQFLGDGRTVLGVWEDDGVGSILARVRYSDHSDNDEWDPAASSSTAGFSDRTEIPGRLTAVGRFGNSLTFHFPGGIVWGHPTGEQSPPLSYQPAVGVFQGTVVTSTLRSLPIGEVFLGKDHQICLFDGSKVSEIGYDVREIISENWGFSPFMHSSIDWYRSEYSMYMLDVDLTNLYPTRNWRKFDDWKVGKGRVKTLIAKDDSTAQLIFNWRTGQWRFRTFDGAVTAVSEICRNNPGTTWENRLDGQALVGSPSVSGLDWLDGEANVGASQAATDMIYRLREQMTTFTDIDPDGTTASFANNGFDSDGCVAISDDFDAALPGVYKHWRVVQLYLGRFMLTDGLSQSIEVGLSSDEGESWTTETVTVAGSTTTPSEFIVPFYFNTICANKVRVRLKVAASPYMLCSVRKVALWYQVAGQVDANFDSPGVLAGDVAVA